MRLSEAHLRTFAQLVLPGHAEVSKHCAGKHGTRSRLTLGLPLQPFSLHFDVLP